MTGTEAKAGTAFAGRNFSTAWCVEYPPERSFPMKKTLIFSAVAIIAGSAGAQEQGRVLSATPIVQQVGTPRQVCGNETVYSGNRTSGAGAVMGAIARGGPRAHPGGDNTPGAAPPPHPPP